MKPGEFVLWAAYRGVGKSSFFETYLLRRLFEHLTKLQS